MNVIQSAEDYGELLQAVVPPLHDHAQWVSVEHSAEDSGDLQEVVLHPLHDQEEGHAE